MPPVQMGPVAFSGSHGTPQSPQSTSVSTAISQPSPSVELQSPKPCAQPTQPQVPSVQVSMATFSNGAASHDASQDPQCSGSLCWALSQPLAVSSSQSWKPSSQLP